MFCPYCGNNLNDSAKFCPKCGKQIPQKSNKKPTVPDTQSTPVVEQKVPVTPEVSAPVYTPPVTPQQPQTPVYTPPVQPKIKKAKPVKEKKVREPLFTKDKMTTFGLSALLFAIYAGISLIFILLLNMEGTISVETVSNSKRDITLTLSECLNIMISGNRIFNPTAMSTAAGLATYIFVYATPAFALVAFMCYIFKTKAVYMNIASTIVSGITALTTALVVPMATVVVSGYKQALSINAQVLFDDIDKITTTKLLIFVGINVALIIASFVITLILKKRRAK